MWTRSGRAGKGLGARAHRVHPARTCDFGWEWKSSQLYSQAAKQNRNVPNMVQNCLHFLLLGPSRGIYEKPAKGFQNRRKASDTWAPSACPGHVPSTQSDPRRVLKDPRTTWQDETGDRGLLVQMEGPGGQGSGKPWLAVGHEPRGWLILIRPWGPPPAAPSSIPQHRVV